MSSTDHRETAKLDRVPLPVEAARMGMTGWQLARTGLRVLPTLPGKGRLQDKVIRQIPPTSSSARSSPPAPARSASR
jgi:ubiquinone biosynthesis protein